MSLSVPEAPVSIANEVSRETLSRLESFAELLTRWNQRINLVSPRDMPHLWDRHIADSLQLTPHVPEGARITDLGSGAGFPGIILAISTGAEVTMVESDQRKAAFLREASRVTQCRTRIVVSRIENANVEPAPVVTARALAALPQLLEWTAPLLASDGFTLFPKGQQAEDELTEAGRHWHMTVSRIPSRSPGGVILKVSDLQRV